MRGVKRINVSIDTLDAGEVQGHHPLGRPRQGLKGI
jgi:molybdenum cofactor biosynthesis enzyme MoaA